MFDDSTQFCIGLTLIFHISGLVDFPYLNSANNPGNHTVLVLGSLTLSPTERAMQFHKNDYYINPMLMYTLNIHVLGKELLKQLITVHA